MTDLLGCRYRSVQRRRFPFVPPTETSRQRAVRTERGRREALALLPAAPRRGELPEFRRISVSGVQETQAALDAGANIITDAEFLAEGVRVRIDVLVRTPEGYLPVVVSSHRVARPAPMRRQEVIPTRRLGLGAPHIEGWKLRNHAADSFRLALADRALAALGLSCGKGGAIGQDPTLTFVMPTQPLQAGLSAALEVPDPAGPHRVKECRSCRYWFDCQEQLSARDDISLLFAGDAGAQYAARGITTVQQLIEADLGQPSVLARAWREGVPLLRRTDAVTAPRFDVEIDIDLEAYLDIGAYLWGAFDGETYTPFVTWGKLGGDEEARNFAEFWTWLRKRRREAEDAGLSFAAFCYSNHGENHWLRSSARRFAGVAGVPSETEVDEFINSPQWIDVFRLVRAQLVGPEGLGLKVVAPQAGFHWEGDLDGEASVEAYRKAIDENDSIMREQLLRYNRDDCAATAAVRKWLSEGAPKTPIAAVF